MRILFLLPYPSEGASNRYRVEQYLPYLKAKGIDFDLRPFVSKEFYSILYLKGCYFRKIIFFILAFFRRTLDIVLAYRYDIVFIHREVCPIGPPFFEWLINKMNKPIIFDFDDAIFLPSSSSSNSFIEKLKNPHKTAYIISMSKCVIVGNNYLANFALKYNNSIFIIPTCIDTYKYRPANYTNLNKNEITIGWIGSSTTLEFLDILKNVFVRLSKRFDNLRLKIVGGYFSIEGLSNIASKSWSLKEEAEDLKTFDIGIMPMPDNEWTRGKCGFKAILYMSMGIPCVCSPVGINKEIITDGVNGFLCRDIEEWVEKISLLITDRQLRDKLGTEGRRTIEDKYSVKVNAPKFLDAIQSILVDSA